MHVRSWKRGEKKKQKIKNKHWGQTGELRCYRDGCVLKCSQPLVLPRKVDCYKQSTNYYSVNDDIQSCPIVLHYYYYYRNSEGKRA